ncbi:hypothetical protein FDK12_00980 [Arthrobacter sp. NamB2]|uniref:hypothetical protein n=1 Tax=Arthrobacter sp. NamB2 TaxID=2576035 RepID=UPI0010C94DAD|nr:hypothetical protein [Arthrobacter sp. NamB2]TKV29547.1 hypothetical protein FDK12_00980 [Arthrobacter sp. NamB2]
MIAFPYSDEQRALISAAIVESGFSVGEVWLHYFSLSGDVDEYEVEAYLTGIMQLPQSECNLLALAVNELIDELPPRRRAPFSDDLLKAHTGAREIGKA